MYFRFAILITLIIASCCFAAEQSSIETELETAGRLLQQAEKQAKGKSLKDQIKNSRKELELVRKKVHDGTLSNLVLHLLSFQKRLRAQASQDLLRPTLLQLSKILSLEKAFHGERRKEFGLQVVEVIAPEGRFSFYLPDELNEGDSFTYSVQMQPFGLTDADRKENQQTLSAYRIEFASRVLSITPTLQQITIGSAPSSAILSMKTLEGFEAVKSSLNFSKQADSAKNSAAAPQTSELEADTHPPQEPVVDIDIPHLLYQLPAVNQAGRFLEIRGPFDGVAENTNLSINKNGAYIIAESPHKMIAVNPRLTGSMEIRLVEGDKKLRCRYRNVDIRSWASAETLASGANGNLTIQLDSAAGLKLPLIIAVENKTPEIISVENGEFQYITVEPGMLNATGSLSLNRNLTGMHPAPFRIDARLDTTNLFSTCDQPD
ncbi:MAG TPA: hypothetical protein VLH08_12945 [Acidobacteriota bacterium]|nr:hypothetical protein [Acidobacteriota bacterium]